MDLLTPLPKGATETEYDAWLDAAATALFGGIDAVRALADGGPADSAAIDRYVTVLEAIRRGYLLAGRTITVEHVEAVQRLAALARTGAPQADLAAAAQHVQDLLPEPPKVQTMTLSGDGALAVARAIWAGLQIMDRIAEHVVPEPSWTATLDEMGHALTTIQDGRVASTLEVPDAVVSSVRRVRDLIAICPGGTPPSSELEEAAQNVMRSFDFDILIP